MAKKQVIEVGNVLELQDRVGELQYSLKQLNAIKNTLLDLSLDLDNESGDGWNSQSAILNIGKTEDTIQLLTLAFNTVFEQMQQTVSSITSETENIYNNFTSNTIKAIS